MTPCGNNKENIKKTNRVVVCAKKKGVFLEHRIRREKEEEDM